MRKRGNTMLLGIDVGGTFTDAVVISNAKILAQAKYATTHGDLMEGMLAALDLVLSGIDTSQIQRVALSTTIVTNTVVEGKTDKVALVLMPGPGLDIAKMVPQEPYIISGYVDHRGREVARPDESEIKVVCRKAEKIANFAVVGKFAVRNPAIEQAVAAMIRQYVAPAYITIGSEISGSLNFWRRTNSAYYNSAVWRQFGIFATAVNQALTVRGITAPVYVLKADGGTLPLDTARNYPVEAIFTGPAASVLGIMALAAPEGEAVSLDIGGTTTDIALWRDGVPLFAERGAVINGYPTAVRSFWLSSVGIGGDSLVRRQGGVLAVGPSREGPPMAVGGPKPTVSDAMIVAGIASFGDHAKAVAAMAQLAEGEQDVKLIAKEVLQVAAGKITTAIGDMLAAKAAEPVERVADIISSNTIQPNLVVGVGGAAAGIAPLVAAQLGVKVKVPKGATVANAVGAAVAKPTLAVTFRADTEERYFTVAELGLQDKLENKRVSLNDAEILAKKYLAERAAQAGIGVGKMETVYAEEFNLVRGFQTVGKIITCQQQIKPGVFTDVAIEEGE
ncbi:MAG: apc3 [Firmicutes bacterium]|nr:apc3 [Bacillota bacterium]